MKKPIQLQVNCSATYVEDFLSKAIYLLVFVHLAFYVGFSVHVWQQAKKQQTKQLLTWYQNLIIGVGLICAFYIGNFLGLIPFYIGGAIFFSLLIYSFSFLLMKRHKFSLEKYHDSTLDTSSSKSLMQDVKALFEKDEIFLDSGLTLDKVSKMVGATSRNLSRAINENNGNNFSEYVNSFRIEKAKKLLVSKAYENEKIATIAYDCGFGNITSFNLAFKAETKHTPSSFRKHFSPISA